MERTSWRRRALSAVIVAFLTLQIAAIARTHLLGDDRFGFVMFREFVAYRLSYCWVMEDGARESFVARRSVAGYGKKFQGGRPRTLVFGTATLRDMTGRYLEWLYDNSRPDGAVAAEVEIRFRVNGEAPLIQETFRWPPVER